MATDVKQERNASLKTYFYDGEPSKFRWSCYDSNAGNLAIDFRTIFNIIYNYQDNVFTAFQEEFLLLKLGFNFTPNYDHDSSPALIGLSINGTAMSSNLPYFETDSDNIVKRV